MIKIREDYLQQYSLRGQNTTGEKKNLRKINTGKVFKNNF